MKLQDALLNLAASLNPNQEVSDFIEMKDDENMMYIDIRLVSSIIWSLYLQQEGIDIPNELFEQYVAETMPAIYNFSDGPKLCIPIY